MVYTLTTIDAGEGASPIFLKKVQELIKPIEVYLNDMGMPSNTLIIKIEHKTGNIGEKKNSPIILVES